LIIKIIQLICWIQNTSYGHYRLPLQATMLFPSFIFLVKFFFVRAEISNNRFADLAEISCALPPEGRKCGGDHNYDGHTVRTFAPPSRRRTLHASRR
jgi:hypothetical protein